MSELPFQAEYAKTGRASCKGCKEKIDQKAVRLAAMVQSAFHDGLQPNWYHEDCFFKKQRPKSADEIGKLNVLRHDDQKRIRETIASLSNTVVMPVEKGKKGKGTKRSNADANAGALRDFAIEYSKSSRAACRVCEIKITKDEVRISKTVFDTEIGKKYGGQALWHHVKCFAEARAELLYLASGEHLPGFKKLKKEDQNMVKQELPALSNDELPVKKLKEEPVDVEADMALEKNMEKQSKAFFKFRDALGKYPKKDLVEILEASSQLVSPGIEECVIHVADIMSFGALKPCKLCKEGQFILDTYGYKCTGNISEWTKCQNVIQDPERVPMTVPNKFKKDAPFKKYKPKVGVRLFKASPAPQLLFVKKEEVEVKKEKAIPPLKNLQFFIYGKTVTPKDDLKKRILKLGGNVPSKLTETIAAVISTKKELEKMSNKMAEIQENDIEVVEESYLDLIDAATGTPANSLQLIKVNNIADWGSDPLKRVPQDVIDGKSLPKSGSIYTKSTKSGPTKLKVKGGSAVDPDSGLEDVAHVYKDHSGTKWTVVLGKTDVIAQKNSYYKLQLLQSDNNNRYWLFRSWGRIGTSIGDKRVQPCETLDRAQSEFRFHYEEKTGNMWGCGDTFVKKPDCYYPIDVDYGDEPDSPGVSLQEDTNCKLPAPVQKLIMKIFDINLMKRTLLEFELDTEKMPLGKLSKKQIRSGYKVLSELLQLIEKGMASRDGIIDATNRFYTLVPHNFGVQNPPLLDNVEAINTKTQMLDNLLEIEIAYSLMKTESSESHSPIEAHYLKLRTEIAPVPDGSPEHQLILKYVENTHAATHTYYTLTVEQVFKVVRDGEEKRFKPFKKLHNRRLLWHGSRVTNFAGILSQGLRIAPPEAPVTGYMFGKGIYFADMVSKSANYCCTNKNDPVGVMLLCEVALGNMKQCTQSEYVTKLPANQHSVWGRGRTQPDPEQAHKLDCGTLVPLGKPQDVKINTSLLYNEFIVYDVAQVNVKYLLQLKFNHKF